jgi:hypothetical protein
MLKTIPPADPNLESPSSISEELNPLQRLFSQQQSVSEPPKEVEPSAAVLQHGRR